MYTIEDVKALREKTGAGIADCKTALEESKGDMDGAIDYLRKKGTAKAAKKESRIAAEGLTNIVVNGNTAVIIEVNSETDFVAKNEKFKTFVDEVSNAILNSSAKTMEEAMEVETPNGKISEYLVNLIATIGEKLSFRRFERVTKADNEVFGIYSHMGGRIGVITVLEGGNEDVAKDVAMHVAAMNPGYLNREAVPADVLDHEKEIIKEQAMNEGKPADIAEKMVNGRINKFYKENCLVEQEFIKDPDLTVEAFAKNNGGVIKSFIRYEVGEGIEKRQENFAEEVMNQING